MAQPWQDWYRLDNAAMVYSAIQRDDYSAVYRFSVVMDHTVEPDLLQRAVQRVMSRFPGFQVRLRRGVFWSYFDADPSFVPPVEPDIANPCQPIRFSSKDRLLRVFYYGPRISIELFHALADGAGALVFLKTLAAEYLRQRALGYEPRFHPPQAFFSCLTWMDNLTDQLARLDPPLAEEYRRCREGLLDSLLRKEDASGDH